MRTKKVRADVLKPGQFLVQGREAGKRKIQRITAIRDVKVPVREGAKKQVAGLEFTLSNGLGQPADTIIFKPSADVRTRD